LAIHDHLGLTRMVQKEKRLVPFSQTRSTAWTSWAKLYPAPHVSPMAVRGWRKSRFFEPRKFCAL
jgi:hypothetical protein